MRMRIDPVNSGNIVGAPRDRVLRGRNYPVPLLQTARAKR